MHRFRGMMLLVLLLVLAIWTPATSGILLPDEVDSFDYYSNTAISMEHTAISGTLILENCTISGGIVDVSGTLIP